MGIRGFVANSQLTGGFTAEVHAPSWLTSAQRKIFDGLVADAKAAKINLAQLDAEAFAVASVYIESFRKKPDVRAGRDIIALLREIGGTPMARARLNVKPDTDKKSRMAQLLKMAPPKTA